MHVKEKYPEARGKICYMDEWSSFHLCMGSETYAINLIKTSMACKSNIMPCPKECFTLFFLDNWTHIKKKEFNFEVTAEKPWLQISRRF